MKFLTLLLLVTSSVCARTQPNIVFILADDLGWADTMLYGHTKLYRTPNLDRLAKRGMTFTDAYAAGPLGSPTRASILTGLSPARLGLTTANCHIGEPNLTAFERKVTPASSRISDPRPVNRLDTGYFTLAEALRDAGYINGHFGKWHLGAPPYSPAEHGFDVDIPRWSGPGPAGAYLPPWKFPNFKPNSPFQHIEDRMAREAAAFIEKNKDRPFFVNYWMFSVHAPFDAKDELVDKYRKLINPKDAQRSPTYAAMVESMDKAVGTLLNTLDRLDLTENTIIVFFSDNGGNTHARLDNTTPTSNRPLRAGKGTIFEGGVRVPMVVSWPGQTQPGSRTDVPVQSSDFYPTFVDLLDLQPEGGQVFDGKSMAAILKGSPSAHRPIFTYFPHHSPIPGSLPPSVSVRHENWKLIREFFQGPNGSHRYRLFDLSSDLGEKNNLVSRHPETVFELDLLISKFLSDTNAVLPLPNPKFVPSAQPPRLANTKNNRPQKPATGRQDDPFLPELKGWKARQCKAVVKGGFIHLSSENPDPFLGVGLPRFRGPATMIIRVFAPQGGNGRVSWAHGVGKAPTTHFEVTPGEWTNVSVQIPTQENLGIIRVRLPLEGQEIRVDWIKLISAKGNRKRIWNF